jgi:hypothetical protein
MHVEINPPLYATESKHCYIFPTHLTSNPCKAHEGRNEKRSLLRSHEGVSHRVWSRTLEVVQLGKALFFTVRRAHHLHICENHIR